MKKSDLKKILAVSVAVAAAAGTAAVVYTCYKKNKDAKERQVRLSKANAYILGGGISALASALYLIRDCGFTASNVHILSSGVYDRGNAATGYICRRGKIIDEKNSPNFFDLISDVRSLDISDFTISDEILNLYNARSSMRPVTFVDADGNVKDTSKIRIDKDSKNTVLGLLKTEKEVLVSVPLTEVFGGSFFMSDFWKLISAAYGLSKDCNAYEFVRATALIDETLCGTIPSDFDRYEEINEPLAAYLKDLGADILDNAVVTDVDFTDGSASAIHYNDNGIRKSTYLNEDDICILPTDEMAEYEALGSFTECVPRLDSKPFALWERLSEKHAAFKNPSALFDSEDDRHMSEEFTITLKSRLLPELIDKVTCGALGTDGVLVLDNSAWKMTIAHIAPSHFKDLDEDTAIIWGTAMRYDRDGEYVSKPMTDCCGSEILYELISCLNLAEVWDDIRETVINVIPCHRRYDKAYLAPTVSKLEIIPIGISNMAVSGDFVSSDGSVFTEEFSVTTAKTAAYTLASKKGRIYRTSSVAASDIKRAFRRRFN